MDLFEEQLELEREDGVTLPGLRVTPDFEAATSCKGAGVLVVGGEWGLSAEDHARFVTPLAEFGYFVVALDLVRGRRTEAGDEAQQRAAGLDHAIAIDDIQAGILCLKELARGKIGVIGLDVAGAIAIEAATMLPHIDAVVHAGGPPPRPQARLSRLRAAILIHRTVDGPLNEAAYLDVYARMRRSKADLLGYEYAARPDFFIRPRDEAEREEAVIAWDRTRDFLTTTLT